MAGRSDFLQLCEGPLSIGAAFDAPRGRLPVQLGDLVDEDVGGAVAALEAALGDPVVVNEVISTFLDDAPELVQTLRRSLEQRDLEELRRAAHTLKSNGRTFGASSLASLSEELELSAQTGSLASADDLLAQIQSEYARVEGALGAVAHRT